MIGEVEVVARGRQWLPVAERDGAVSSSAAVRRSPLPSHLLGTLTTCMLYDVMDECGGD